MIYNLMCLKDNVLPFGNNKWLHMGLLHTTWGCC